MVKLSLFNDLTIPEMFWALIQEKNFSISSHSIFSNLDPIL